MEMFATNPRVSQSRQIGQLAVSLVELRKRRRFLFLLKGIYEINST
jgi:hypothetical protein